MARTKRRGSWVPLPAPAEATNRTDTLIISDVHLGLKTSRPRPLLETLRAWRFERLILLGDILHDHGFQRFCADSWRVVAFVRELAVRGISEVVWIDGNHDRHLRQSVAELVDIEIRDHFAWSYAGRRFVAVHGDCFDGFVSRYERFGRLMGRLYGFCQHNLSHNGDWTRPLDRLHARLARLDTRIAEGAAALARSEGADVVVCGHTHTALSREFDGRHEGQKITYVNAGAWVNRPASFLTVDAAGIRINCCA